MRKNCLAFVIVILICSAVTEAQCQVPDSLMVLTEGGWIQKTNRYAIAKLSLNHDVEGFTIENVQERYEIFPNTPLLLRAGFNYSIASFSFGYAAPFFPGNNDTDEQGKTRSFSLGMDLVFRRWMQSVRFSTVKGYYLNNTKDFVDNWQEGDPYAQFPDLRYTSFSGSTGYSVNPRFSVKSLTSQTERQMRSAGTFLPMLYYRYYIIGNEVDLSASVPERSKSNNIEVVLTGGYHYTFVIKQKFYASLGLAQGFGFAHSKNTTEWTYGKETNSDVNSITRFDGRTALGYNGARFFTGFMFTVSVSSEEQQGTAVIGHNARAAFQLHVGYRFVAPKILREKVAYVMSKNPFSKQK